MFRLLADVFHFLLWWCFLYVGSFMLFILGIFYVLETTSPPETHYTTFQVNEPPKRVLVERKVCNRIDECRIVNNVCVDCITVRDYVGELLGVPMSL